MKAFMMSMAVLAVITIVSSFVLESLDMSAEQVFSSTSGNVRL